MENSTSAVESKFVMRFFFAPDDYVDVVAEGDEPEDAAGHFNKGWIDKKTTLDGLNKAGVAVRFRVANVRYWGIVRNSDYKTAAEKEQKQREKDHKARTSPARTQPRKDTV